MQDQVLSLIEFDIAVAAETEETEIEERKHKKEATDSSWVKLGSAPEVVEKSRSGTAIDLLVDHTHSIPVSTVILSISLIRLEAMY